MNTFAHTLAAAAAAAGAAVSLVQSLVPDRSGLGRMERKQFSGAVGSPGRRWVGLGIPFSGMCHLGRWIRL